MVNKLVLILAVSCFAHDESKTKCDPFPFGTNILNVVLAAVVGSLLPNSCPCDFPCSMQSVQEHVQFFYTKSGSEIYHQLNVSDTNRTMNSIQDDELKFLIHGYTDRVQFNRTGWMEPTGFALANATNGTVILVDYKNISSCSYSRSVQEIVPSIGLYLASIITRLNLNTDKIELIGHSLGAHIAGYAGASLNGSISRITGLDPAGPGFDSTTNGLNKTCAKFVQVLHTNPGELGTNEQRGDLNFYANNKTNLQPGCPFKQCGHAKAIFYYFASLFPQNEFIGVQCEQQDSRQVNTGFIRFGFFDTDDGYGRGNFCFNTTSCFPFTSNGSFSSTTIDVFSDTLFTVKAFSTDNASTMTPSPTSTESEPENSSGCRRDCNDFSENSDNVSDSGYED